MNSMDINKKFHDKLQSLMSRKAKHSCMYFECNERAVNSHTMSKKSSLYKITKNGKLITPKSLRTDKNEINEINFKEVGIERATTFHGFCKKHELIFSSIDLNGIKTLRDLFLQIYRYSCKKSFTDSIYRKIEIDTIGDEFLFNLSFEKKKEINSYKIADLFFDLLIDFPEADKEIKDFEDYKKDFFCFLPRVDFKENLDTAVIYKKISFKIPLALETKLSIRKSNKYYDSFIILIPNNDRSDLIIICHENDINEFLSYLQKDIDILSFIERSMMLDGEWWLSPDVVKNWSDEKLKMITNDFRFCNEIKLSVNYDISLFDELRTELCKDFPENERNEELKKIDSLPERKSFEEREKNFRDEAFSDMLDTVFKF